MKALATVVEARSNSRISGATSCEVVTWTSGKARGDDPRRVRLVPGIGVRVQEHDGHRGHARAHQGLGARHQGPFVERLAHAPVRAHALRHFEAEMAGHQRGRARDVDVVQLVLALASDLQRVGEARGGDEPRHRPLALDEGVGEERGGVHHAREVGWIHAALAEQSRHPGGHRAGRIVVGGEDLAIDLPPALVVVDDEVGEGTADVDPERVAGHGGDLVPCRDSTRRPCRGEV